MSFARNGGGDHKDSFSHYHVRNVEIKDFNVLIDGRRIFDLPVKNKGAYEKIIEMSTKLAIYTQLAIYSNLLVSKKNCRLIAIDFSKHTRLKDPRQINFIGKLEEQDHDAKTFLIIEKSD